MTADEIALALAERSATLTCGRSSRRFGRTTKRRLGENISALGATPAMRLRAKGNSP
jgi:hypothetical protein